jgi:hypothetical protein
MSGLLVIVGPMAAPSRKARSEYRHRLRRRLHIGPDPLPVHNEHSSDAALLFHRIVDFRR